MMGNPSTYDVLDNVDMFRIFAYQSLIPLRYVHGRISLACQFFHSEGSILSWFISELRTPP